MEVDNKPKFQLNREPNCCCPLGELKPSPDLTVLYKLPLSSDDDNPPLPYPEQPNVYSATVGSTGDNEYAEMPFRITNESTSAGQQVGRQLPSQWPEIVEKLTTANITTVSQLITVIKSYNERFAKRNFNILRGFFKYQLSDDERSYFFSHTLPRMIRLTIQLPNLITKPIPILKQKMNHTLFFSQQQIASVLANGFFCTFPEKRRSTSSKIIYINFIKLFSDQASWRFDSKLRKLACLLNYFRRITNRTPKGIISFERRYLLPKDIPKWKKLNSKLSKLIVTSKGTIEEKGKGLLQINSTYKLVAADYLNYHTSLSAYRFMASPELLMIGLFTESLLNNESLIIVGVEQFNKPPKYNEDYDGQKHDFKDKRPFNDWNQRYNKVVCIDAKYHARVSEGFRLTKINRDLNKAYCGIMDQSGLKAINKCAICTPSWGCGASRGDPQLNTLILLIAASVAERDLLYCTYGDKRMAKQTKDLINKLHSKGISVSQLYNYLEQYCEYAASLQQSRLMDSVFIFLEKTLMKT